MLHVAPSKMVAGGGQLITRFLSEHHAIQVPPPESSQGCMPSAPVGPACVQKIAFSAGWKRVAGHQRIHLDLLFKLFCSHGCFSLKQLLGIGFLKT